MNDADLKQMLNSYGVKGQLIYLIDNIDASPDLRRDLETEDFQSLYENTSVDNNIVTLFLMLNGYTPNEILQHLNQTFNHMFTGIPLEGDLKIPANIKKIKRLFGYEAIACPYLDAEKYIINIYIEEGGGLVLEPTSFWTDIRTISKMTIPESTATIHHPIFNTNWGPTELHFPIKFQDYFYNNYSDLQYGLYPY